MQFKLTLRGEKEPATQRPGRRKAFKAQVQRPEAAEGGMSQVPRRTVHLHAATERLQDEVREVSSGYFRQGRAQPQTQGSTPHTHTHAHVHTFTHMEVQTLT